MKRFEGLRRGIAALLVSLLMTPALFACGEQEESAGAEALGTTGHTWALELAAAYPFRSAYSEGEKGIAKDLTTRLEAMGYQVQHQAISGSSGTSENLIVRIPGKGFTLKEAQATDVAGARDSQLPTGDFSRLVVIGAKYGTPVSVDQGASMPDYDGISDNASGTAALLLLARELKNASYGFDIELVFWGADSDAHRGSQTYYQNLSETDLQNLYVLISLESLYAGDKLYANAGSSSASHETRKVLRAPVHQLLDVSVSYYTGQRLLDNQGGFSVQVPGSQESVVYREFTLRDGAFQPFDAAGLPVISIESGDYAVESLEAFRESKNPKFLSTKGMIRGTNFDATNLLKEWLPEMQLRDRINAVVYWLKIYLEQGLYYAEKRG